MPAKSFIRVIIVAFLFYFGAGENDNVIHVMSSINVSCLEPPRLTLYHLAANISYFDNANTSLRIVFFEGKHTLDLNLSVSKVSKLVLTRGSLNAQTSIICNHSVGFSFSRIDYLQLKGLVFIGCGNNMIVSVNRLVIDSSSFIGQKGTGTALQIIKTNATTVNSNFSANTQGSRNLIPFEDHLSSPFIGGAIIAYLSNINITNNSFTNNSADLGGAMFGYYSNISIISSSFTDNQVTLYNHSRWSDSSVLSQIDIKGKPKYHSDLQKVSYEGTFYLASVISAFHTKIFLQDSIFHNNKGICGGAMSAFQSSTALINNSNFTNNSATHFGGVFMVGLADIAIYNCSFYDSYAKQHGGVLKAGNSSMNISHSIFKRNNANWTGGVLRLDQSSRLYVQRCTFTENQAYAGGVVADNTAVFLTFVDSTFLWNVARNNIGGAIFTVQSKIHFNGRCSLNNNSAREGGAIYTTKTEVNVYEELIVSSNAANHTGGGIYLFRSNLNCHYNSKVMISQNNASSCGGGIHSVNSLITLYCDGSYSQTQAVLRFSKNMVLKGGGGGICLESYAYIYIFKSQSKSQDINLQFVSNKADYGEAVYVNDHTYFELCNTLPYRLSECFIQLQIPQSRTDINLIRNLTAVDFSLSNSTNSLIFGGLLDRCSINRYAEIVIKLGSRNQELLHPSKHVDGATFLQMISNLNDTADIHSTPIRLCFCTPSNQPDCSYIPPTFNPTKGEKFNVPLVAVDQVNHTITNVTIHAYLNSSGSRLDLYQRDQKTNDNCTNLTYSISSPNRSVQIILYADGPCRNASRSQGRVNVYFAPCNCPLGFQNHSTGDPNNNRCECICHPQVKSYVNKCNPTTKNLSRDSSVWISYITGNNNSNTNTSGYLIYHYCPFDYCLPKYPNVQINLNVENGADAQCAHHRSGLLCGQCKPGHSLSYGSSHCVRCPRHWYWVFLWLTFLLFLGVFLVVLLMFLNITVAVGTINGPIFYANIIGIDGGTFPLAKFFSAINSLLNLKIGIDTCFFFRMDTFWKTWLQLAFPTYLIVLVIIIIMLSQHSIKFSRLIAKKNPVATLATLILLSYTIYLQNAISILFFGDLHYPDGSIRRVWLPDASIDYLKGRHITLFIVAIFILIIGVAYTCILFTWQWLLYYEDKPVLAWVRSAKLKHFIEPYHAPYKFKHRYWTGLLLFVRVFLYLVFAFNISGDPKVNLTAIILVIGGILFYKGNLGQIYQKKIVDVIEMMCYLNIGSFSVIQIIVLQRKTSHQQSVNYAAYLSGIVTFLLLLSVVMYHAYPVLCGRCLQKSVSKRNNSDAVTKEFIASVPSAIQSSSEIEGVPNYRDRQDSASQDLDDVVSIASMDSTTPLLDE